MYFLLPKLYDYTFEQVNKNAVISCLFSPDAVKFVVFTTNVLIYTEKAAIINIMKKKEVELMNITEKIKSKLSEMTKSERHIASYCMAHLNDFAFCTLDAIAEKIETSTTSVIRFCRRLDFSGYKQLQASVRAEIKEHPALPDKFDRTVQGFERNELLIKSVNEDMACIHKTFSEISIKDVAVAVKSISEANRVFVFGMRESFAIAHYAYTRFLTVRSDVFLLNAGYNGEIESLLSLKKGDACVVSIFHRYTKSALEILKTLKKRGVFVIVITDSENGKIKEYASVILVCYVDSKGIKNSAVAPVCLLNYLCSAVAMNIGESSLGYMKESEELFKKISVLED